jgi:hypothetical protein
MHQFADLPESAKIGRRSRRLSAPSGVAVVLPRRLLPGWEFFLFPPI